MGESTSTLHQSGTYPWSPKPWSGHAFEDWNPHGEWRLHPGSVCGSVCDKREHTLPAVLFAVSLPAGGGHSDITLAKSPSLRVSSGKYFACGVMQNQEGESIGEPHCPELAESALVSGSERDSGGYPLANSPQEGLFLQNRLDNRSLLSTLKVYVAAIASFRSWVDGQLGGMHGLLSTNNLN